MKTTNWIAAASFGAIVGVAMVVACSDDSPGDADAAACECPAAEPPLAGRIVSVRSAPNPINPGSGGGQIASCPTGATLLGGACELTTDDPRVLLTSSRILRSGGAEGYVCNWSALEATVANTCTAEAICLIPAP